jgi:type I restriction enzyme S subunit
MIEDLKPYPEYKDSGLPWLGDVPAHWEIKRGKSYLKAIDKRSNSGEEELLTVSSTRGVVPRRSANVTMFKANSYTGHKLCWPGDLVINSLWAWNGGLGVSRHHGIVSTAYGVYRARNTSEVNPYYLHELLRSSAFQWELQARSKGVWISRLQLTDTAFLDAPIPLPPPEEQAAIARFLAWATNRLDRAIGAKRRIIALLQEQKQAIIHRAVTQGLDPSVPLKDSGIPWLGEIPEHWEVRRLRTVVKTIDQGVSPLATGFLAEGNSWGVLKSGCVNRGVFRETEHKQLSQSFKIDSSIVVKPGDVLISRACGSPSLVGSVGRVGKLNYNLILSDKTFRPNFEEGVDADFMVLAMNSTYYRRQVEQAISGAEGMANNLPISSLRDFSLAIPLLDEAKAIAFSINKRLAVINLAIASNEQEITLLREYRTRLMADVVTGKLDVREVAAGLPEEVEPSIQSDAAGYDGDDAEDDPSSDPIDTEED